MESCWSLQRRGEGRSRNQLPVGLGSAYRDHKTHVLSSCLFMAPVMRATLGHLSAFDCSQGMPFFSVFGFSQGLLNLVQDVSVCACMQDGEQRGEEVSTTQINICSIVCWICFTLPGRNKDILNTYGSPLPLANRLLKQWTPRNWNFPRNLMLCEGKKKG